MNANKLLYLLLKLRVPQRPYLPSSANLYKGLQQVTQLPHQLIFTKVCNRSDIFLIIYQQLSAQKA